jgi:hypothetical protein
MDRRSLLKGFGIVPIAAIFTKKEISEAEEKITIYGGYQSDLMDDKIIDQSLKHCSDSGIYRNTMCSG